MLLAHVSRETAASPSWYYAREARETTALRGDMRLLPHRRADEREWAWHGAPLKAHSQTASLRTCFTYTTAVRRGQRAGPEATRCAGQGSLPEAACARIWP